ncbi:MAG: ParA family protein [Mariprofundales bacterium]|nr:ParA family protein [Mariprofundales bacterium]
MKVIAVANKKGGSGKSTSAVNLAAFLAHQGIRTLVVDLDAQAHATIGCGIKPRKLKDTVHHLMASLDGSGIAQCIRTTEIEHLSILPAQQEFDVTQIPRDPKAPLVLHDALELLEGQFDAVVIDSPPSLDLPMYNAVLAADSLLIPFQPGFLNYDGVGQMLRVLFKAAAKYRHQLELLGVLPVMVNASARMHRQILKQALEQFGKARVLSPIRRDIKLEEAFMHHQPIVSYAPYSGGALCYKKLAQSVAIKLNIPAGGLV